MLIITNRKINEDNFTNKIGNENAFGDELDIDAKGQQKLRFAMAKKANAVWQVELIEETNASEDDSDTKFPSFEDQYCELRKKLAEENKNCIFFVHGFNQSFKKNLKKSLDIENLHSVEVIMFSWPSNPMKHISDSEYKEARIIAKKSAKALNLIFTELDSYHEKLVNDGETNISNSKISLLVFSLGNYLFQEFIQLIGSNSHLKLFNNVILCQADVNRKNHKIWGDKINVGNRVYTTINRKDDVLRSAYAFKKYTRLGRTTKNLNCKNMTYFDFTDGTEIKKEHELFRFSKKKHARNFFTSVLDGVKAEKKKTFKKAFIFSKQKNCYEFRVGSRADPDTNR